MEKRLVGKYVGITKEAEEKQLQYVLSLSEENIHDTERFIRRMEQEYVDFDHDFTPDDRQALGALKNLRERIEEQKRILEKAKNRFSKPYFGRVDIVDPDVKELETFYIGKTAITENQSIPVVIDWRSPLASVYYENHLGDTSYAVNEEIRRTVDLKRKRNYEISDGKLIDFYDTEIVANDDLLNKYLKRSRKNVLSDIIATIQEEQNAVIRKSPFKNLIVQGAAGSGKTTVAMHRISQILYNYQDQFRPEDFYIIGSNQILLNYITGVLPDLDVDHVSQMTMEELMCRLLYEDWNELSTGIIPLSDLESVSIKGTSKWFQALSSFLDRYELDFLSPKDVYIKKTKVLLLSKEDVLSFMKQQGDASMLSKAAFLNEVLLSKLENELLGKNVSYSVDEKKELVSRCKTYYGKGKLSESIFDIYQKFIESERISGKDISNTPDTFDLYDLSSLAFIYKRLKETEVIREASHVVIDEAQDFGMLIYHVLKRCLKNCTFSIMGDVSQNIRFGSGLDSWEELDRLMNSKNQGELALLKKSYRNTIEISSLAQSVLSQGEFLHYEMEPIIRHGNPVEIIPADNEKGVLKTIIKKVRAYKEMGHETISIITRTEEDASTLQKKLSLSLELNYVTNESTDFSSGVTVLPISLVKGLEFDAVIIYNPVDSLYKQNSQDIKLLYVALTRALHDLSIIYTGTLSTLLTSKRNEEREKKYLYKEEKKEVKVFVRKPYKEEVKVPLDNLIHAGEKNEKKLVVEEKRPVKMADTSPSKKKENQVLNPSPYEYGSIVSSNALRPKGHSTIDTRIRFIRKNETSVEAFSGYGVLLVEPLTDDSVRIRFVKTSESFSEKTPFTVKKESVLYKVKETRELVEISLPKMNVVIDKNTGTLSFTDEKNRILLSEKAPVPRQIEKSEYWSYFNFGKKEKLFSKGILDSHWTELSMKARYISFGKKELRMPLVFSENGYGIAVNAEKTVSVCTIPMYGPYIYADAKEIDYVVMASKDRDTLVKTYHQIFS